MSDNHIVKNSTVAKIAKNCNKMTESKEQKLRLPRLDESSLAVTGNTSSGRRETPLPLERGRGVGKLAAKFYETLYILIKIDTFALHFKV